MSEATDLLNEILAELASMHETLREINTVLHGKTGVFGLKVKEAQQGEKKPVPQPRLLVNVNIKDLSPLAQEWLVHHVDGGLSMRDYDPTGKIYAAISEELKKYAEKEGYAITWIKDGKNSRWEFEKQ